MANGEKVYIAKNEEQVRELEERKRRKAASNQKPRPSTATLASTNLTKRHYPAKPPPFPTCTRDPLALCEEEEDMSADKFMAEYGGDVHRALQDLCSAAGTASRCRLQVLKGRHPTWLQ
eukprot:2991413-Amphidinium_carterae.1